MRTTPDENSQFDMEEVERLKPQPWMLDLLKMNPEYTFWGPHEDYMWKEKGWDSAILLDGWKNEKGECQAFGLDDLNEVVNFYFELERNSIECPLCGGTGYHPDSLWVSESFYRHSSPFTEATVEEERAKAFLARFGGRQSDVMNRGIFPPKSILARYGNEFREFCEEMREYGEWNDRITQDEVQALVNHNRLGGKYDREKEAWVPVDPVPTAAEVNAAQHQRGLGGHDGINRSILIEARLKRFGMPTSCPKCDGHGREFTEDACHVNLVLWVLHPRKGCSRGVEVKNIGRGDLPEIYAYLRKAAERNAGRFSRIPNWQ